MVMLKNPDGTIYAEGLEKVKDLIRQRFRFAGVTQDLGEMFETVEALEKLCEMSGGHARNLMSLMKVALQNTTQLPIKVRSVQRAVSELRDTYRKIIDGHEWEALVRVSREKVITDNDDLFRSLLFRRCILEYRYIDDEGEVQVWHDVHPLVRGLEGFKRAVARSSS